MKENNYLRLKIYFFIFIIACVFGWITKHTEIVMIVENRDIRKQTFNYAAFCLVVAIGFTMTLLYDIYTIRRNKKVIEENSKQSNL